MILQILTMALPAVGVGAIISGLILRRIDHMEKSMLTRAEARIKENVLFARGLQAIGYLSKATAVSYKNQRINGEMDAALKAYEGYKEDMDKYLIEQNAVQNHGKK